MSRRAVLTACLLTLVLGGAILFLRLGPGGPARQSTPESAGGVSSAGQRSPPARKISGSEGPAHPRSGKVFSDGSSDADGRGGTDALTAPAESVGEGVAAPPLEAGTGEAAAGGENPERGEGALAVLVRDADGQPIAGAAIRAQSTAGTEALSATTSEDGLAELEVPEGKYLLVIQPPEPAPPLRHLAPVTVSAGERIEVRCLVPALDAEIAGRVLNSRGEPVEGIEVEARPMTFPGGGFSLDSAPRVAASGPEGEFRLSGLAPVEHLLSTRETPGHLSARNTAVAGSAGAVDLVLADRRGLALWGTVTDRNGKPVPAAAVSVPNLARSAMTDAEGRYRLEIHYERGSLMVRAAKDGDAQVQVVVPPEDLLDREELELPLRLDAPAELAVLTGSVSSEEDQTALAGQVVRIHSPSLNLTFQGGTGTDGLYSIGRIIPAEDYRIWINPQRGYRDLLLERVGIGAGENRLDLALAPLPTARISGVLLDPDGRPLPRLTLWVRNAAAGANSLSITGDARGSFEAAEVPAGEVFFETRAEPRVTVTGLQLAPGEDRQVELVIGLGKGILTGKLSSEGGGPLGGGQITLSWNAESRGLQSRVFRQARSDAGGNFTMSGLARGRCLLSARVPGYRDWAQERDLTGGNDPVNITLVPLAAR